MIRPLSEYAWISAYFSFLLCSNIHLFFLLFYTFFFPIYFFFFLIMLTDKHNC